MSLSVAGAHSVASTPRSTPRGTRGTAKGIVLERFSSRESTASGSGRARSSPRPASATSNLAASLNKFGSQTLTEKDFSADVGRKAFGFSHEDIGDAKAYYEGQFDFSQRSGAGMLYNPETGAKYVGQFRRDLFHGHGENRWADGSTYVGQWKQGRKHGEGEFTSVDGLKYSGQWENGVRHGKGSQEYANKDQYEGSWWHGLCSGVGTYRFPDGSMYKGIWGNGRYDGSGVLYGSDGSRERQWHNNGFLMKREVLSATATPRTSTGGVAKKAPVRAKVVTSQDRIDMHRPALMGGLQPSTFLIQRETAGMDLRAPPLRSVSVPHSARAQDSTVVHE